MKYIDEKIQDVKLTTLGRGKHKVEIFWNTNEVSYIMFSTKKEAKYYYDWVCKNPKHTLHKNDPNFTTSTTK